MSRGGRRAYVAGAKKDGDTLLTAGGRVLGITAAAPTLRAAVEEAYRLAEGVHFAKNALPQATSAAPRSRRGRREDKWYFGLCGKAARSAPEARRC